MREQEIIRQAKLPTLSKTLHSLADLERRNPVNHTQEFTRIIHMDPALSAHILRVANSPHYGMAAQIRSIGHAVTLLGIRKIRNLAFSQSISDFFRRVTPGKGVGKTFHDILKKTLLTAAVAQTLAQRDDQEVDSEEIYATALLSEVGQIILFLHNSKTYQGIHSLIEETLVSREQETFGCDHVSLGLAFVTQHGFPESFRKALQNHIDGADASPEARILRTANLISQWLLNPEEPDRTELFRKITEGSSTTIDITPADMSLTFPLLLEVMERLMGDFPEIQTDLTSMIRRGGEWITQLLQQGVEDQEIRQQLLEQNQQIGEEKSILFHLLQLASRISAQTPLEEMASTLIHYGARLFPDSRWALLWQTPSEDASPSPRICTAGQPLSPAAPTGLLPLWKRGGGQQQAFALTEEETLVLWPQVEGTSLHVWAIPVQCNQFSLGLLLTAWNTPPLNASLRPFALLAHLLAQAASNHLAMDALQRETEKKDRLLRELQALDVATTGADPDSEIRDRAALATLPVIFHKLKNRLTPVLGYTQILLQRAGEENDRKRLQKIESNSEELHRLLNMLRTSIPQATSLPLKTTDLATAFSPILEPYRAQNPQIRWNLPVWDPAHLLQIHTASWRLLWKELLDNSLLSIQQCPQETGKKGEISLTCSREDEILLLELRDSGASPDDNQVTRLGEPFVTYFEGEHAGLGLVLARWHAQQNRAELVLERDDQGVFVARLRIPLREDLLAQNSRHVVLIDDEPILLDLMQDFLRDVPGLSLHAFSDGAAARHFLRHHAFDLVISDIHMPEVDGVAILETLASRDRAGDLIWITGGQLTERQILLARRHSIALLYKPFSLLQFRDLILRNLYKEDSHV